MKNTSDVQTSSHFTFAHQMIVILTMVLAFLLWSKQSFAIQQFPEQMSEDGADVLISGGGNTKIPDDVPANAEIQGYCSYCKQNPLTDNSTPSAAGSGNNGQGQGL